MDDQGTNRARGGVRFRKLRIAWSVGCGVACLLLIALWVQSYRKRDYRDLWLTGQDCVYLFSYEGKIEFAACKSELTRFWAGGGNRRDPSFEENWTKSYFYLPIPYVKVVSPFWLTIMALATIGIAPWIHWRFSLRTLFVATTLAAFVLEAGLRGNIIVSGLNDRVWTINDLNERITE